MTRVLVTGLGVVSPYGAGGGVFWEGLTAGRCAVRPIELFDTEGFRARVGAEVPAGTVLRRVSSRRSRSDRFAAAAADEAVRDAGLSRAELRPAAVIVGGIGGGMLEAETWFWRREREGVDDPELRTSLRTVLPFAHAESWPGATAQPGPRRPWSSRAARVARPWGSPPS